MIAAVANADITRELIVDVVQGEHAALSELLQASRASEHPLGNLPIVVLTRGLDSAQQQRELHASFAGQSTRGRQEVVEGSHHEIHLSHPAAVVKAIQDVLAEARRP